MKTQIEFLIESVDMSSLNHGDFCTIVQENGNEFRGWFLSFYDERLLFSADLEQTFMFSFLEEEIADIKVWR